MFDSVDQQILEHAIDEARHAGSEYLSVSIFDLKRMIEALAEREKKLEDPQKEIERLENKCDVLSAKKNDLLGKNEELRDRIAELEGKS